MSQTPRKEESKGDSIITEATIAAYVAAYGLKMLDWDTFLKEFMKSQREAR